MLRFDSEVSEACESLIKRVKNVELRKFYHQTLVADGTKGLAEVLVDLDNPQKLRSSKAK